MYYATARQMAGGNGHEHIAGLRWLNTDTQATSASTTAELIRWIRDDKGDLRVQGHPDSRVGVVDAEPKYLRSYADAQWNNNLLSLPTYA